MWEDLVSVLTKILALYKELLVVHKEKCNYIVTVNYIELKKLIEQEQTILGKINKLDKERSAVSFKILGSEKIDLDHNRLQDMIKLCDQPIAEKLNKIHRQLNNAIGNVTKQNHFNSILTSQALGVVEYKLNILAETCIEPIYVSQGKEKISNAKRFDYRA